MDRDSVVRERKVGRKTTFEAEGTGGTVVRVLTLAYKNDPQTTV